MVSIIYLSMIILSAVMLYFIGVYNNYVVWQLIKYHLHYTWLCFHNLIPLRGEGWRLTSMLLSIQCVLLHTEYVTHELKSPWYHRTIIMVWQHQEMEEKEPDWRHQGLEAKEELGWRHQRVEGRRAWVTSEMVWDLLRRRTECEGESIFRHLRRKWRPTTVHVNVWTFLPTCSLWTKSTETVACGSVAFVRNGSRKCRYFSGVRSYRCMPLFVARMWTRIRRFNVDLLHI